MKATLFLSLAFLCMYDAIFAQNVGIGTTTPHNSAVLDIQSSNKGVSLPSMTSVQRLAISSPKIGLLVFDTDKNTIYMYDGAQWLALLFTVSPSQIPPILRTASDGQVGDQLGYSVAINGNYAIIGAPFDNVGANTNQGCAYIFFRNGSVWSEQAKLVASDGAASDLFGCSVAINGSYAIVGAYLDNTTANDAGSAYVFIRSGTTWTEQAKLTASNAASGDHFGFSVSINGSYAVVGSKDDDIGSNADEGSAYFFNRSGTVWTQQDNVVAPFGAAGDYFGCSVAISGDYAVIGAYSDDVGADTAVGSAHVFVRNGVNWDYHDELSGPGGQPGDHFGYSVAIDGNYVVVGAPSDGGYVGDKAYIFFRSGLTWSQQAVLYQSPQVFSSPDNRFGISVSIDGDYVIVGATQAHVGENLEQGASYVFKRDGTTWIFVRRIYDPAGEPGHLMGAAVGVSGFNTIVAAPAADALKGRIFFLNVE